MKNLKLINLQLFADESDNVDENDFDDENGNDEVEEDEETTEDNGTEETTKDDSENESNKSSSDGEKGKTPQKAKQSKEKNSYYADLRRQKKITENEFQAKAREEGRIEGLLESINHINPYTNEKIMDQEDIDEYLLMKKIEDNGDDPIKDYHKFAKELSRKNKQELDSKKSEEDKRRESVQKDVFDFDKAYPNVNRSELLADGSDFLNYAKGFLGKVALTTIYENWLSTQSLQKTKEENKQLREEAKKQASPKSVKGTGSENGDYYSMEQIKAMSQKEVTKNYDKVMASIEYHNSKKRK